VSAQWLASCAQHREQVLADDPGRLTQNTMRCLNRIIILSHPMSYGGKCAFTGISNSHTAVPTTAAKRESAPVVNGAETQS
jgi:hypothetical protein